MALTLATFNVKDLLEPRREAERKILDAKLAWIAQTLRACDADVIGLQEVGSTALVRAVLDRIPGHAYGEPVMGTTDARGIGCAVISRLRVTEARVHTAEALPFPVFQAGDPAPFGARIPLRRGVVHVRVEEPRLGPVDVLVAHFKSARPGPARDASGRPIEAASAHMRAEAAVRSLVWRAAEALYVRRLVDEVLVPDPNACVAVVGDLNDVPGSPAILAVRGEGEGQLFDCAAGVEKKDRFSAFHDGRADQIDYVLASGALYALLARARFLNLDLRQHPPVVTGDEPPSVDSDHAPLVTRFG
jgi:endonuclease/exonuclease/phosphatase family metal-dependent hydrolase